MIETTRKILRMLTARERRRGLLVLLLMIAMAAFEVAGIASVMPFLTVMGDPEMIQRNAYLQAVYSKFDFDNPSAFLVWLAVFGLAVLLLATIVRLIAQYAMVRFAQMRRHSVARRLLYGHLCQPYEFFLKHNSADLSKTLLSEVDQLTLNVIQPALHLVAYGSVCLAVVLFLLALDPIIALTMVFGLGGFYGLTYWLLRGLLQRLGQERVAANAQRFKAASEALGGIQELKVLGREQAFFDAFDPASRRYARHLATAQIIAKLPKRVVEMLGFAAILIAAIYLIETLQNLGEILPILGAYAVAGNRLLPALQEVYQALAKLRFGRSAVDTVEQELNTASNIRERTAPAPAPLRLRDKLVLENVDYTYPGQTEPALSDVTMHVPAGATVSVHGTTGAGKSTLVKILLGLLPPDSGAVAVDGRPLDPPLIRAWQRAIGYVPQEVFLVDSTVRRNIALGVPDSEIDDTAVVDAAKRACIHDFIMERLPQGYETFVGERGIRLSGGQRQRLTIARALYQCPNVLIMDEATSSLDPQTEADIFHDLMTQQGDLTIIAITHRDTIARLCDRIYRMERGRIVLSEKRNQPPREAAR